VIVSFAIGNSDDKLSQARWAAFVAHAHMAVDGCMQDGDRIHFAGYSAPAAPWQNAVWVIQLGPLAEVSRGALRANLAELAGQYGQDSIAWWEAAGAEMIPPAQVTTP
jgi:hypothetical protein